MTLYIHPMPNLEFDPPFINASKATLGVTNIELGSGSGLIAVSVAKLLKPGRDHLIVTDLPEVCPLLENNLRPIMVKLEANSPDQDTLTIRPLSWGRWEDTSELASLFLEQRSCLRDSCKLTHIICSDLVYFPELLGPLLRSLLHLTSPPFFHPKCHSCDCQCPAVFISCKIRSLAKETAFWSAFGLWFTFNPVLVKDKSAGGDWRRFGSSFDDTIFLFVAHRRAESYAWIVPALDEDLLCGVGANGTSLGKGDDSFENLLLMSIEQD
ncbi:hypothetical protein GALMADRAFT_244688 [Galerina marginata CBS 339.88]|uniref:Methyltransferase small domain-containing protein n=1 Tax=Galerina marginata (strain CBS 339.88) TaxID=685588 RepID=A0A067TGG4_GALM3|nr:hypothetical protein GALMADRAFT_244688 [Galerina marginata CBS 339.88]